MIRRRAVPSCPLGAILRDGSRDGSRDGGGDRPRRGCVVWRAHPWAEGGPAISSADEQRHFRQVIGHFATGVAVISAHGDDGPGGLTANALCSLSLHPPLLLVCFDNSARTLPMIRATRRFALNILRHEQHALSGVFASKRPEREKFRGVPYTLRHGVPVLDQALAWLACDLREEHQGGDHTIGIGAVTEMHHHAEGKPLVWYRGRYGTLVTEGRAEARLPN